MERRLQLGRFRKAAPDGPKEKMMNIKKILTAAAAATVLSVAGASAASADSWNDHGGYNDNRGYDNADRDRYGHDNRYGHRDWREHRRFADRRIVFETLRQHHIRYSGEPYFVRGHYVVRSFDRFGRVSFIEINPYTGGLIGVIRL
jgi:hypothetical protein